MIFPTTRLVIAVLGLAVAAKADTFANFFDDDGCNDNGGIGVDMNNDGCLAEAGRGSVYIPNTGLVGPANQYCLVITSGDSSCTCQSRGYDFTATGFCAVLDPNDQSYRFIHQPCGANNC